MRTTAAVTLGKAIAYLSRQLKIGGGSAAPGLYALKLDPNLVAKLSRRIPKSIVITGTNGKTTTARMLAHFAKESGLKVIRNHTGSNLERGIASALISNSKLLSTINQKPDLGIWELDEAAFNTVAPKLKPEMVVFLNVFRDQLDRYGEIDTVVKNWCQTLKKLSKQTIVLVNGDDLNTAKLEQCFKGRVLTFGVKDYKLVGESLEKQKSAKKLDFEAKDVELYGLKGSSFQLSKFLDRKKMIIKLPLPGVYHIYDSLAAIACAHYLNLPDNKIQTTLKSFQPAFGRVEKLPFGYIFLIKNPAGATQVFETIAPKMRKNDRLLMALNDNLADGTDVSWIWDAEFEKLIENRTSFPGSHLDSRLLQTPKSGNEKVGVSGTRAPDLALRLKYAGFDPKQILIEPNLKYAFRKARTGLKGRLFILPTYTAMLDLQAILTKMGIKKHYWQENN